MDELTAALHKYHRELFRPDFERTVGAALGGPEGRLVAELRSLFAILSERFDRLDAQGRLIAATLKRIEDRLHD